MDRVNVSYLARLLDELEDMDMFEWGSRYNRGRLVEFDPEASRWHALFHLLEALGGPSWDFRHDRYGFSTPYSPELAERLHELLNQPSLRRRGEIGLNVADAAALEHLYEVGRAPRGFPDKNGLGQTTDGCWRVLLSSYVFQARQGTLELLPYPEDEVACAASVAARLGLVGGTGFSAGPRTRPSALAVGSCCS